jgi:hypothetical protein
MMHQAKVWPVHVLKRSTKCRNGSTDVSPLLPSADAPDRRETGRRAWRRPVQRELQPLTDPERAAYISNGPK